MPSPRWSASQRRDVEAEKAAGVADFDARYAAFLRGESVLSPPQDFSPQDERRRRIESLITQGATEVEREAARAALARVTHAEQDRMQRGGNWIDE